MPKTLYTGSKDNSGVDITWTPTAQRIDIGGWYDGGWAGIQGESMTLHEFFDRLGITEKDCQKAFGREGSSR